MPFHRAHIPDGRLIENIPQGLIHRVVFRCAAIFKENCPVEGSPPGNELCFLQDSGFGFRFLCKAALLFSDHQILQRVQMIKLPHIAEVMPIACTRKSLDVEKSLFQREVWLDISGIFQFQAVYMIEIIMVPGEEFLNFRSILILQHNISDRTDFMNFGFIMISRNDRQVVQMKLRNLPDF